MLPESLKKEFEEIVLLYISDELSLTEKKYWDDLVQTQPELKKLMEEYESLVDISNELPVVKVDNDLVNSTLEKIVQREERKLFVKLKEIVSRFEFKPALRFAIVILFFATGLLIVHNSDTNNNDEIEALLDWEGNSFTEKIESLDNKIELIEAIDKGLTYEKPWNEKINNIDERIKYSSGEQILEINQSFIRNLSE